MGRIVVTEFMSLDGVVEDPGGAENFAHGGGPSGSTGGRKGTGSSCESSRGRRGSFSAA